MELFKAIILLTVLAAFVYTFIAISRLIFNTFKVITNITGKYAPVLGPLILFMPTMFNEEGNRHRVRVLYLFPRAVIGFLYCFGVMFLVENFG